jgi:hypothetical protein
MPPAVEEAVRPLGKGLLCGLRCTLAAVAQAFEPEATLWPSADWRGLGCSPAAEPRDETMVIVVAPTASSAVK